MGKGKSKKIKMLEEKAVAKYGYQDRCSSFKVELWINKKGKPIYAGFGNEGSYIQKTSSEEGFDSLVKSIMISLIDHDLEKFRDMRRFLNDDYFDMSENVRIITMNRYDF